MRPAPLGTIYERDLRLGWLHPRSDAAPNGARRVLCDRGYKDFAPPELGRIPEYPNLMSRSSPLPFSVS
jgi:hypothetical protein